MIFIPWEAKTLDLCFVVDLTASMHWWLQTLIEKMEEIIQDNLQSMGDWLVVYLHFPPPKLGGFNLSCVYL